jgi:hypothetical protein
MKEIIENKLYDTDKAENDFLSDLKRGSGVKWDQHIQT